jgi:threonine aldolase
MPAMMPFFAAVRLSTITCAYSVFCWNPNQHEVTPDMNTRELNRQFASDNWAGICPEAWAAMEEANRGHAAAYGEDRWTTQASNMLRDFFETDCQVFFVFNGTAANSLALASLCKSFHSVICHESAHIETDECGAPEFFSHASKILTVGGANGKVDTAEVEHCAVRRSDIHYPKPHVLSLTQATEFGTVYSPDDLHTLSATAQRHELRVHMDGARFGNALAHLDCAPKEITWEAGVDVLCLGGTKSGMAMGEAVVFFDTQLAAEFDYRCKQAGQLASKMRFLSSQWVGMLQDNTYTRHARHANACAQYLADKLAAIDGITLKHPVDANAVFADLPADLVTDLLDRGWEFYTFIGSGGARFMCSWDTSHEDIDGLLADIAEWTAERSK